MESQVAIYHDNVNDFVSTFASCQRNDFSFSLIAQDRRSRRVPLLRRTAESRRGRTRISR